MLNKTELLNKATRTMHKINFKFKKHSPELLVSAGVIGLVGAGVMACKATTKLDAILSESKEKIETFQHTVENPEVLPKDAVYTEEDCKNDTKIVCVKTAFEVGKLYAPSVIVAGISIAAIFKGHQILRTRNIALAAAYATVDKSFKEYRGRVVERFGKELDKELRYNIKTKEVEKVVVNEDGSESVVKEVVEYADLPCDPNKISDYARFFDDGNIGWTKDPNYNLMIVRRQQDYFNDLLKTRGYVFLNEVYDAFGWKRIPEGQLVGWVYNLENPTGDNYIDFGIYDLHRPENRRFVNGLERTILLDFNVDGNIIDLI